MQNEGTKEQIVRKLRKSDEPALSASDLAERLGVSVRTINNHTPDLIEQDRIETTQIGNATAYYIPFDDLPPHDKPGHSCKRCGRTTSLNDFAKVEHDIYFEDGDIESQTADFSILCRFCYSDYVSWIYGDEAAIGDYPRVHSWSIPETQLREVRRDPDIETCPPVDELTVQEKELYDLVKEVGGDEAAAVKEIQVEAGSESFSPEAVESLLKTLAQRGHLFETTKGIELAYLAAK